MKLAEKERYLFIDVQPFIIPMGLFFLKIVSWSGLFDVTER